MSLVLFVDIFALLLIVESSGPAAAAAGPGGSSPLLPTTRAVVLGTTTAEAPGWPDVVSALSTALTALALVAGGLLALRHYRLEDPHAERADLTVEGDLIEVDGAHLIRARICMSNSGRIALHLCKDDPPFLVARPYTPDLMDASTLVWPSPVAGEEVFSSDSLLEAGETLAETTVLPIRSPPPDVVLYQLLFYAAVYPHRWWGGRGDRAKGFSWQTTELIPVSTDLLGSSAIAAGISESASE